MRCIHCGKEIRDGVIFCIHCDRPAKREYAHYACEIYDSISIFEKILNLFYWIVNVGHGWNHKDLRKYNYHNKTSFKSKAIEKLNTAAASYRSYIQSSDSNSTNEQATQNQNMHKPETDSGQTVKDEDYLNLNEIVNSSKEFLKKIMESYKNDKNR